MVTFFKIKCNLCSETENDQSVWGGGFQENLGKWYARKKNVSEPSEVSLAVFYLVLPTIGKR